MTAGGSSAAQWCQHIQFLKLIPLYTGKPGGPSERVQDNGNQVSLPVTRSKQKSLPWERRSRDMEILVIVDQGIDSSISFKSKFPYKVISKPTRVSSSSQKGGVSFGTFFC